MSQLKRIMDAVTSKYQEGQPRYRQLASALITDIRNGRLRVGETLPGELDLVDRFHVSRHTVREALRMLDELGLIERRQGVGTVVKARQMSESYVQKVRSPAELLQYPHDNRLVVYETGLVKTTRKLARLLQCATGTRWFKVGALRRCKSGEEPICWLDLYLVPEYASVAEHIGRRAQPVYEMIEQRFGERVATVQMAIQAGTLTGAIAESLGVDPGTPSLRIVRRYLSNGRRVLQIAVSEHPADRYTYSLELKRSWYADGETPAN